MDDDWTEDGPYPVEVRSGATRLPAYLMFLLALSLYYVGARLLEIRPAVGTSTSAVLGLRIVPDLVLAYIASRVAWVGVIRARTLAGLKAEVRDDLLNRRTLERILGIPLFVLGTVLAFDVYGAFKQAIPELTSYAWDGPLSGIDWLLHLGRDPWTLTAWIQPDSWAFHFIDQSYQAWFLTLIISILVFATWAPSRLRIRFFISMVLILVLGGTLGAVLFASGGPVYYGEFTGDAERFAPLLQHIEGTSARHGQRILWEAFSSGSEKLYGGISAMPSMHVGMAVLMAVGFYWWNRAIGWVVAFYMLLIQIGSVHLGWHYAVDGYVAALLTLWIWSVTGRILRRLGWPETDVREPGVDLTAPGSPPAPDGSPQDGRSSDPSSGSGPGAGE